MTEGVCVLLGVSVAEGVCVPEGVKVAEGVRLGETVDVNVKGCDVAIPVTDLVSVTEVDCVSVCGNEVGIGECDTEIVLVVDIVARLVIV